MTRLQQIIATILKCPRDASLRPLCHASSRLGSRHAAIERWILGRQPVRVELSRLTPEPRRYDLDQRRVSSRSSRIVHRVRLTSYSASPCQSFSLGADSTPKRTRPAGASASATRSSHLSSSPLHAQHTPTARPTPGPSRLNGASPARYDRTPRDGPRNVG